MRPSRLVPTSGVAGGRGLVCSEQGGLAGQGRFYGTVDGPAGILDVDAPGQAGRVRGRGDDPLGQAVVKAVTAYVPTVGRAVAPANAATVGSPTTGSGWVKPPLGCTTLARLVKGGR